MDNIFFRRWLLAFWLILAGLASVIWIMRCESVVTRGAYYVTTGFEDISIFNIDRIRYGDPAYVDCFQYPYRMSLFNWLFYALYGGAARLVDPSEEDLPLLLRLITLLWTVGGYSAVVYFLRRCPGLTRDRQPTMDPSPLTPHLFALVTWFGPTMGWWSLTARPDVPAVVCAFLGLMVVLLAGDRLSWRQAVLAGVLFFLAWSLKQSAVFILAGTLLGLLLRREWSGLLGVGSAFAGLVAAVFLAAGPDYFANLFEAPRLAPLEARQLNIILFWWGVSWAPLLLMGLNLLFALRSAKRVVLFRSRPMVILILAFGVTLAWGLFAARRRGSSANYFFEAWITGMALVGLIQRFALGELTDFDSPLHRLVFESFSLLLLGFSLLCVLPLFRPAHQPETEPLEVMLRLPRERFPEALLQAIRTSPRPIYVEDAFLVRLALGPDSALVPVTDHTIYQDARKAGRLKDADIFDRIEQHSYTNLWLYTDRSMHPSFLEQSALKAGYLPVRDDGFIRQYVRPGRQPPARSNRKNRSISARARGRLRRSL